ncbi:MAG TPA: hypothetical protein VJT75_15210 [Thermoleophilaceae bacterium]|nr:hypothetical protein [Thermoleophilaceae bacterium]
MTRLEPPSGEPPPVSVEVAGGEPVDLVALAREICRRYRAEYPDEADRYGDAGIEWCLHDNQHILNWAVLSREGHVDLESELAWLARVLAARDFPLERLARNLEIAADVVRERLGAHRAVADDLAAAARSIAS